MPGETAGANKGYLQRILSDGESAFSYRGRVRTLLGFPDAGGVAMNFAQPLPFAGLAGVRARDGMPEDLRLESPPGDRGVRRPMQPGFGNEARLQSDQSEADGLAQAPTTRRPDARGRTKPMIADGTPAADALSPSGLNTEEPGATRAPAGARSTSSPAKIHHVVVPGNSQPPAAQPHGNVTRLPMPAPVRIPSSANDGYPTIERPRSTTPGPSPDGELAASVATSPAARAKSAAIDTRPAPDAAALSGPPDEPSHPVAVSRPQPMPGLQPRSVVSPAHEQPSLKTSTISALEPVGIHRGDSEMPPRRFSATKPGSRAAALPTGAATTTPQGVTPDRGQSSAYKRNKKGAETSGHASADSAADQPSAVPLPQPPVVVVQQAQGPPAPTPAYWERRHLALWRLRFGR